MVFSGLVTAWRFAGWPTRRSPSSVKATIDGVVRAPSAFSMTLGVAPSITATQELVVPRSIPITFAIEILLTADGHSGPLTEQPRVHPLRCKAKTTRLGVYRDGGRAPQPASYR